jgi:hypothetical protein
MVRTLSSSRAAFVALHTTPAKPGLVLGKFLEPAVKMLLYPSYSSPK